MTSRRPWVGWVGANLVFATFHPQLGLPWPALATSLAINAVLFVLPGASWSGLLGPGTRALGMRMLRSIALSTGVVFVALVVMRVGGLSPSQQLAWNLLWALTNAGFVAAAAIGPRPSARRALTSREIVLAASMFAGCYTLYYYTATRVVPPLDDQDLEVQATGYGLITRFEPLLLTDRHAVYFFAHPPLLHFYVGESFLLYGSFQDLEFFDEVSQRARAARESAQANQSDLDRDEKTSVKAIEARLHERPHLLETRTPNVFFSAATVALLAVWAARICRRWWMGLLAAVAYATNPEVLIRSSYGGYFALGGLVAALMLLAAERWRRWPGQGLALSTTAGWMAALVDHKLVMLPVALQVSGFASRWVPSLAVAPRAATGALGSPIGLERSRWRSHWLFHPVAVGFGLGLLTFWTFGFAWAPVAFVRDHFRDHLIDRITHDNPLQYAGYLTPFYLWREFVIHTAFVLVPVALSLLIRDALWPSHQARDRPHPLRGLWLVWTLLTAAAFTVVDWRMTKHLVPMLLPLHLALVPSPRMPMWRVTLAAIAFAFIIVWNLQTMRVLMTDFAAFRMTPAW